MSLKNLQKRLEKFNYVEKAALTKKEIATLEEMFLVPGSFKALFRHLCILETDKGTQMIYDVEQLPSDGNYTDREIADLVRFKKMSTGHVRERLEALRTKFALDAEKKVTAKEKEVLEEREKNEKAAADRAVEVSGVAADM